MFVRERGPSAILNKARTALGEHQQFVGWKDSATETGYQPRRIGPGDEARLADLNVFFVHTASEKR